MTSLRGFYCQELARRGIQIRAGRASGLAEEVPLPYKDVDALIAAVAGAGIARVVGRLEPLALIKG